MYPTPQRGSSLLLSFSLQSRTALVVGSGQLAAQRTYSAFEAGARVVVLASGKLEDAADELQWRVNQNQAEWVGEWDGSLDSLQHLLENHQIWMAFITTAPLSTALSDISTLLHSYHILTNITDHPSLCDFSFTSTHRFSYTTSADVSSSPNITQDEPRSPLQIGVTTNGHGCRLAARVRREIVARLPSEVGEATRRVGMMRKMVLDSCVSASAVQDNDTHDNVKRSEGETEDAPDAHLNKPVLVPGQSNRQTDRESVKSRQLRWLAQISEYWPFSKLASLSSDEMRALLDSASLSGASSPSSYPQSSPSSSTQAPSPTPLPQPTHVPSQHFTSLSPPTPPSPNQGEIFLVGSGPGNPALLTVAAYQLLTGCPPTSPTSSSSPTPHRKIDLILSDKLVPSSILALIPSSVTLKIARKFPGNADASQKEMMELAVQAANKGLRVVRLKQGDPAVYARLSEECLYFTQHGYTPLIIPGLSSALTGPLMAYSPPSTPVPTPSLPRIAITTTPTPPQIQIQPQPQSGPISLTSRGTAESFTICTGVGRGGKSLALPGYERGRSTVVLMGVARIKELVGGLLASSSSTCTSSSTTTSSTTCATTSSSSPSPASPPSPSSSSSSPSPTPYPPTLPICIIERASMPDQRVISSTLSHIVDALAWVGEQRPPGMIVIGWCCLGVGWGGVGGVVERVGGVVERIGGVVEQSEGGDQTEAREGGPNVKAYDDLLAPGAEAQDEERIRTWLGVDEHGVQRRWRVSEGMDPRWDEFAGCL